MWLLRHPRRATAAGQHGEHRQRVDAEKVGRHQRDSDGANAHAATAEAQTAAATGVFVAPVLKVIAFAAFIDSLRSTPCARFLTPEWRL